MTHNPSGSDAKRSSPNCARAIIPMPVDTDSKDETDQEPL
jgi:hypothetical protein